MHIVALALSLLASSAAAAPPPPAAPSPATPSTRTSTSDSGADAKATAEAKVAYFFSTFADLAAGDAPLGPQGGAPPRMSRPASPSIGSDPRELPRRQPAGFAVGAFARAEAHASSRSKSSTSSAMRPGDGRDQASSNNSSSRSRAKATAEARVMVIGPFAAPSDSNNDARFGASPQLSPAERAREQSLTQLAATKDWAAAVTTLGQTYLDNPELLSAPIDETSASLGMSIRELADRAITLARRENKLAQWITAAALLHADGRTESAKALLAKAKLANPVDAAKLEDFRTTLRIRTTPTTP